MTKMLSLVLFSLLILSSFGQNISSQTKLESDADDLTSFVNGIWEQNDLVDPTDLPKCYNTNATLSSEIKNEITAIFLKASSGKISDLTSLQGDVENFYNSLPQSVQDCFSSSTDMPEMLALFPSSIDSSKLTTWVTFHLIKTEKKLANINDQWVDENYNTAGNDLSELAHLALANQMTLKQKYDDVTLPQNYEKVWKINKLEKLEESDAMTQPAQIPKDWLRNRQKFTEESDATTLPAILSNAWKLNGIEEIFKSSDSDDLTEAINGIWAENILDNPTDIITCYNTNATLSTEIKNGILTILEQSRSGYLTDMLDLQFNIEDFIDNLPTSFKNCWSHSLDLITISSFFPASIDNTQLNSQIVKNLYEACSSLGGINSQWVNRDYYSAGKSTSKFAHVALAEQM